MALYEVLRGMVKVGGILYKKGDKVELTDKDEKFLTKKGKVGKASIGSKATKKEPSPSSKAVAKKFLKKKEGAKK